MTTTQFVINGFLGRSYIHNKTTNEVIKVPVKAMVLFHWCHTFWIVPAVTFVTRVLF